MINFLNYYKNRIFEQLQKEKKKAKQHELTVT